MSEAGIGTARPLRLDFVVIAGVVLAGFALLAYVFGQSQQELRRSPAGLDGLQVWLSADGGSAQSFTGGWLLNPAEFGLAVVPLHDTDLQQDAAVPRDKTELLFRQDERDLYLETVLEKAQVVPTLMVLPKWRSGMRLTGIAHPALLVEPSAVNRLLADLVGEGAGRVQRIRQVFTDIPYRRSDGTVLSAKLYAAQLMDATGCTPLIGEARAALMASCPLAGGEHGQTVIILSDPDMVNNHGLRLGDNALIARDILRQMSGEQNVLIDYSDDNWFSDEEGPVVRERTWADLLRFLEPPFLALWLGAGTVLALAIWRSARRAGPVVGEAAAALSKVQAIAARARLMRLTGQDGAMVGDYASARIAATAMRLVGPGQARLISEDAAFLRYIGRRRADLAARLEAALTAVRTLPARVPGAVAIRHVDEIEQILEQITHEP